MLVLLATTQYTDNFWFYMSAAILDISSETFMCPMQPAYDILKLLGAFKLCELIIRFSFDITDQTSFSLSQF